MPITASLLSDTEKAIIRLIWDWDSGRFCPAWTTYEDADDSDFDPVAPAPWYFVTAPLHGLYPKLDTLMARLVSEGLIERHCASNPVPKPYEWLLPDGRTFRLAWPTLEDGEPLDPVASAELEHESGVEIWMDGERVDWVRLGCDQCPSCAACLCDVRPTNGSKHCQRCRGDFPGGARGVDAYFLTERGAPIARELERGDRPFDPFTSTGVEPTPLEPWKPKPGYVGTKTICQNERFRKRNPTTGKTKNPRTSTICRWRETELPPDTDCDPATGEIHYPPDWVDRRWNSWSPQWRA